MKTLTRHFAQGISLIIVLAGFNSAFAFYNPHTGRWISRDPIGERGGANLYRFAGNDAPNRIDPLGLSVYIMTPAGLNLDDTRFDEYVLAGFQKVIGDCARLHKAPIFSREESGFAFWKSTSTRLVGWKIYSADEKPGCTCNPCWQTLKGALGDNLPARDVYVHRGQSPFFRDNARTVANNIQINEQVSFVGPEVAPNGNVVWNQTPFEVVLWHETIGHAYLDLSHPNNPSNQQGGGGQDPTILEENNARKCLRLQGTVINDRVPTYYGWPRK